MVTGGWPAHEHLISRFLPQLCVVVVDVIGSDTDAGPPKAYAELCKHQDQLLVLAPVLC